MVLMSGAGMVGTQFQQHGEEPDTFKVRGLCPCNWFCSLESHRTFHLSTGPYSVMIKTILVLIIEIHSCMCLCDSPWVLASSQLDGLVAGAPWSVGWGAPWGRVGQDVHIPGDTLMYTYIYMCTCLCVSSIKTTVHLVVLVCTLIWLNKTFVFWSMWSQGMDTDSVCGSSAVLVDLLRPDGILH